MNLEPVRAQAEILLAVKERRRELDDLESSARAAVEEAMGENEIGELDGKVVVTWRHVKSRRLNQKWLRENYPDIHEICRDTTESRQFKVEG